MSSDDEAEATARGDAPEPPSAWTRVEQFIRLLAPGGTLLEPFMDFFSGGCAAQPYRDLLGHAGDVEFRFPAADGRANPHGTFTVTIHHRPVRAVVELPRHLASLDAAKRLAATLSREGDPEVVLSLSRLRHMVCMSLHLVFLAHLDLMANLYGRFGAVPDSTTFKVSCEDSCSDPDTVALSRRQGARNILMPDPAFFESEGYRAHKRDVLTASLLWEDRRDEAIWRGATTGSAFSAAEPLLNERIALASLCATRPDLFDAKISHVVQVAAGETEAVEGELKRRGLLARWSDFSSFARHKTAIHIDGNASAAGFMEKLSLGCCVLKVDSAFEQWIEPDVEAWKHFVPVKADLSDLIDKADLLRRCPDLTERIARAGFGFALDRGYMAEAGRLVAKICDGQRWEAPEILLTAPPPSDGAGGDGWHDAETTPDGRAFRWTAADQISWQGCDLRADQRPRRVVIPILGEIVPHFAAKCRIRVGERTYPVAIEDGRVVARVVVRLGDIGDIGGTVTLLTPPPVAPSAIRSSDDARRLGLSVRIGPSNRNDAVA